MRLRVRHAGGQVTLSNLTPETTVLELKWYISKALELQLTQGVESERKQVCFFKKN